jgi:hypothetical protein
MLTFSITNPDLQLSFRRARREHFPKTEKAPNDRGFFLLIPYYLPALS